MAKTSGAGSPEFRSQMIDLVHAGRTPEELAHAFEPTAQSIRNSIHPNIAWESHIPEQRIRCVGPT